MYHLVVYPVVSVLVHVALLISEKALVQFIFSQNQGLGYVSHFSTQKIATVYNREEESEVGWLSFCLDWQQ